MKPIVVVDGSSYLFRAYYAMPPLLNAAGHPTGAMYGVINMLRTLLKKYPEHLIIVVFDPPGKTFRHDLYPAYKANRDATPLDLQQQIAPLHAIISAMGFPLIVHAGVEADDVIGTLAHQAGTTNRPMVISTGDKDMAQLVSHHITLLNTMTDTTMDPVGVLEKFGVSPAHIIDYLALVGDAADNIPGVPGVGPKTAVKLLKEYGDLEHIIRAALNMTGKIGESLRQHTEALPLYRRLVTIKTDVPLTEHIDDLHMRPAQMEILTDLFTQYGFKQGLAMGIRPSPLPSDDDTALSAILRKMETHGVLVDCEVLVEQSAALNTRMLVLETDAYQLAGHVFNLSSPKQLQAVLFEELKLPMLKKTPGGQPSTAENVLQALAIQFPLPRVILEYRTLSTLKRTYTDKLPLQINPNTQRIHTSYHQNTTSTGRLSSTHPNLQNIPIRSVEGRKIRAAFIAPPGYHIVDADYSQIELRIMAHFSQDPGLLAAFHQGLDIHQATAAEMFDTPLERVTSEQRRQAKTINFGLFYGMSAFGLSQHLGIGRKEAQHAIERYFQRYPQVQNYIATTCAFARQHGYVETLSGRRIQIPDIQAISKLKQQAAERVAINAPIQGTAADIMKKAMIRIDQWISTSPSLQHSMTMMMQVHDELVFEVATDRVSDIINPLREHMENATVLDVPLVVHVGTGLNWDQAHAI